MMPVVEMEIGNQFAHMRADFREHAQTANECNFMLEVMKAIGNGDLSEIMPNIVYEETSAANVPFPEYAEEIKEEVNEEEAGPDETFEML